MSGPKIKDLRITVKAKEKGKENWVAGRLYSNGDKYWVMEMPSEEKILGTYLDSNRCNYEAPVKFIKVDYNTICEQSTYKDALCRPIYHNDLVVITGGDLGEPINKIGRVIYKNAEFYAYIDGENQYTLSFLIRNNFRVYIVGNFLDTPIDALMI